MPLSNDLKETIQKGYRDFLNARELKPRLGQKQMIAAIANSLGAIELDSDNNRVLSPQVDGSGLCVVEAGTGTGKTLAYLLATLPIAKALDKKVVIATGTVSLQEQLVLRDIPELLQHTGWDTRFALAKGRGRYLCPLKLEQCLDQAADSQAGQGLFPDEMLFNPSADSIKLYNSMADALAIGQWQGDRDSWPDGVPQEQWQPLTVDRRQCAGRSCRHINNCCFFRARDDLGEADCIVANHDLVMSDLALGGGIILSPPEDTIYIFDEGHRLPDTALRHFASHCQLDSTGKWLQQIDKQLKASASNFAVLEDVHSLCAELGKQALECASQLAVATPQFSAVADRIDSGADRQYRFANGDIGAELRDLSALLGVRFAQLEARLESLTERLGDLLEEPHCPVPRVDLEQLQQVVGGWLSRTESSAALWAAFATADPKEGAPSARWLSLEDGAGGNLDIRLSCSPIVAAPLLREQLWGRAFATVITSATLCALNSFDRFRSHAGTFSKAHYQQVPGAFDYANSGVLSVPKVADASDAYAHTDDLIDRLPDWIDGNEGTLMLFASRRQMEQVFDNLPADMAKTILVQGDYSHAEVIRRHKERIDAGQGSVIFGLASFAEGVDLPGDYCRHVIIAKIPFAVPNEPIQEALAEWVENKGGKPFFDISLPDASLKLIQAVGRLLRTEQDTGKVTVLDRRVVTKGYGRQLLDSLPPFRREIE
ncbi:ATP-dependent DNA helicase DinG [Porticoccus sp. GXU_MW_L64]